MPNRYETTPVSDGDQTWIASTHGTYNAASGKLLASAFSALHPEGYIPSGTPLALNASGEYVPYNSGATDGTQNLRGFLLTDQKTQYRTINSTDAYINAAVLYHGRVRVSRLPQAFTAPAQANNLTTITFE